MKNVIEVLGVKRYRAGYEVRRELVESPAEDGEPMEMRNAYNPRGEWIGEPKVAYLLVVKRGIAPEKSDPKHVVCSIGFCTNDGKWYGWSHRAIQGFGFGDMIFEEDFGDDNTPFRKHGSKPIVTFEDARKSAIAFAESVS